MSEYKVPITTIREVFPHTNSDNLEFVKCYDFNIIVRKNKYKVGDQVLYIPIDSILPQNLTDKLFPADSKIKLHNNRVKQVKIRGMYSQGMVVDLEDVWDKIDNLPNMHYGQSKSEYITDIIELDVSKELGITKYEPGPANFQSPAKKRDKPKENPFFHKYGGIDNAKWHPNLFTEGELVSVTEKIHGSNIRFGYVPYVANNLYRKILKFLGLTPKFEWVYGSNNVQLQQRSGYKGYYGEDVYGKVLAKSNAQYKVNEGEIWYGELYGDGIQKNYTYGCKNGEHKLVVFDVKLQDGIDAKYVGPEEFKKLAVSRGFEIVPEIYNGPFNKEKIEELTKGDSIFVPSQKVREGIVIKPVVETEVPGYGRKLLKMISVVYLEKDQTDFH